MSELYDRINQISKAHGLNITSLCKKAGVARSLMSELNMGRTKTITLETAAKFADALGISVDDLLGVEQKEKPATEDDELNRYLDELRNRPEMRMLFSVSEGCTKEEVEQAVRIIEALRGKQ